MGSLEPTMRRVARLGLAAAGSLIGEVRRRDGSRRRRTPDRLLVADASGFPGPALADSVADYDRVLIGEVDRAQARELAVAAGRVALRGIARRLAALLTGDRETEEARAVAEPDASGRPSPTATAERAAWERFVVALEKLAEVQAAYALEPDELGAETVRWAEVDLEDAVAVAGEFEVKKIRWLLT
jgi:hypothetical protein